MAYKDRNIMDKCPEKKRSERNEASCSSPDKPQGLIDRSVKELEQAVCEISITVNDLQGSFGPVLHDYPPSPEEQTEKAVEPDGSDLGKMLHGFVRRLRYELDRIRMLRENSDL